MSVSGDAAALKEQIAGHFQPDPPKCLGVAISGGSDSLALLALLRDWALAGGPELRAVTVDHGLRPEAAREAAQVGQLCASWGVAHDSLKIEMHSESGNLMDMARRGRYASLSHWARAQGLSDIALGHTADDLAETFLMRLSREAGLNGLSAMSARRVVDGVTFHRPLLTVGRSELRGLLQARGISWVEDPTNDDPAYDRARAREILKHLEPLGISTASLAKTARNLRQASEALGRYAASVAEEIVRFDEGDVLLDRAGLFAQPEETVRALMLAALNWVGNEGYPPRGSAVTRMLSDARAGTTTTLRGCCILSRGPDLWITREWKAVADLCTPTHLFWDGSWQIEGPHADDLHVAALGEAGLPLCPDRKKTGRPAASLVASPAVWKGAELIAAPLAGLGNGWSATVLRQEQTFYATLLSH